MISVHEKDTQLLLQGLMGKDVHHVLDPTLLLSKDQWLETLEIKNKVNIKEKYILLYTVPKNPLIRNAVEYFSKKTGYKVVALDQGLSAGAKVDKQIRDAGPIEFLELFSNAAFVITDSFHGTCFSINLEKPFITVSSGS
ncbi:polysaccharide pyruvyl transferase family protein, partial [Gilvimarinus sp. SDUM040013]|uniref:polysaccharide pyruvyl transferase family protein n=1 Tax=Gilvimarinus gilvus TaxID=3058038 RepID=UPI0026727AAB